MYVQYVFGVFENCTREILDFEGCQNIECYFNAKHIHVMYTYRETIFCKICCCCWWEWQVCVLGHVNYTKVGGLLLLIRFTLRWMEWRCRRIPLQIRPSVWLTNYDILLIANGIFVMELEWINILKMKHSQNDWNDVSFFFFSFHFEETTLKLFGWNEKFPNENHSSINFSTFCIQSYHFKLHTDQIRERLSATFHNHTNICWANVFFWNTIQFSIWFSHSKSTKKKTGQKCDKHENEILYQRVED